MRLLNIRLKNIQSLKGEHTINFAIKPLADAGLFLISGPTGAGKSTLLDVISLALFNKIPRFAPRGTESVSRNEVEKAGSIITHFTDEAYAQVEYEAQEKIYRSTWRISKNRNGNFRDYEMELAEVESGLILDLKKSQVPDENARILGLNYEQFVKSIILSQGDFARFLRSDEKERAKLLEEITGSHIYRKIGQTVYAKNKVKTDEITRLHTIKEEVQIMSEVEVQAWLTSQNDIEKKVFGLQISCDGLTQKIQNLTQKLALIDKKNETLLQIGVLDNKFRQFDSHSKALAKHRALESYRGQLTLWQSGSQNLTKILSDQKKYESDYQNAREKLELAINKLGQITGEEVNEADFMSKMKIFETQIIEWDNQLNIYKNQGTQVRQRLKSIWGKVNSPFFKRMMDVTKPEDILNEIKKHKTQLSSSSYMDLEISQLEHLYSETQEKVIKSTSMLDDTKKYHQVKIERAELLNKIQQNIQNRPKDEVFLKSLVEELNLIDNEFKSISLLREKQLKEATFETHRRELTEGEPCPLCGSIHHPYSEDATSKIQENIIGKMNELQHLRNTKDLALRNFSEQIALSKNQLNNLKENEEKLSKTIEEIEEKWSKNIPTFDVVSVEVERLKTQLSELSSEKSNREEQKWLDEAEDIALELINILEAYNQIALLRQAKFKGTNIHDAVNPVQNEFSLAKEALSTSLALKSQSQKDYEEAKESFKHSTEDLQKKLSYLSYDTIEEALKFILDDSLYQSYYKEETELIKNKIELSTTIENIEVQLKHMIDIDASSEILEILKIQNQDIKNQISEALNEKGQIMEKLQKNEEQIQRKKEIENKIESIKNENLPLFKLNELIGDATGTKYAKFAQNLSLYHLISKANVRLHQLSDRYRLDYTDIEDDLRIVDFYQAETTRSVKTLSGGETFLVSLAMALSLSDMASQAVKMESLFIDEGFGTLDQETLEMAIGTLERLQSDSQKTIGIISHVELLKERIHTQIKVQKNPSGYSTLEVV